MTDMTEQPPVGGPCEAEASFAARVAALLPDMERAAGRLLLRFGYAALGDVDSAAGDAVGAALLDALRQIRAGKYEDRGPEAFAGWLARIVRRRCADIIRAQRRAARTEAEAAAAGTAGHTCGRFSACAAPDPAHAVIEADSLREAVTAARLSATQRACLMAAADGEPAHVTAARLGITPATARNAASAARKRVRDEMGRLGVTM